MRRAAILAGGRARRFGGVDKSALIVGGRTILERQSAALRAVPHLDEIVIVGSPNGVGSDRATHGLRQLTDPIPELGPLGGIYAALRDASDVSAVLILACDMPYVTTALVQHLFEQVDDADVVVPRTERGYHPLCAVYTGACTSFVERRLAQGQLRVMDLFNDVRTRVVWGEELDQFGDHHRRLANVNTPSEYAAVELDDADKPDNSLRGLQGQEV